jgi:hypothetical protein
MKRPVLAVLTAPIFLLCGAGAFAAPPPVLPSPAPAASPTASPPPEGTEIPPDANRVGISGVWEIQIQQDSGPVVYTHFKLTQNGTALTGQYLDTNGKKYPLSGTVDGKNVRVVVTMPSGSALIFSGEVDAGTDMAGVLQTATNAVGFTAAYRPKYKWIDNVNPSPGGGMGGGGVPY